MMDKKKRPGLVEEWLSNTTPENSTELVRLANLPNCSIPELHSWLLSEGFKGSLRSVYTWHSHFKKAGEKALVFNKLLQDYQGVAIESVLQKLLVCLAEQIDNAISRLQDEKANSKINPAEYLRALPNLGRELRAAIQAYNELQYVKDRKALELAGALRMAKELQSTFLDTPFESALNEAVKGVMQQLEEED